MQLILGFTILLIDGVCVLWQLLGKVRVASNL